MLDESLTGAFEIVHPPKGTHMWDAPPDSPWLLQSLIFIVGPALLGMYVVAHRRLLQSLVERAERAERVQRLLAEQARIDERARLAAGADHPRLGRGHRGGGGGLMAYEAGIGR